MCRELEKEKNGKLWKSFAVGGREFRIYFVYYEDDEISCPDLPDFKVNPEYTARGDPFTLAIEEACNFAQSQNTGEQAQDCMSCKYFLSENDGDPIGICLNPLRKKQSK